jgi:hypothetical protein
MNRIFDGARLGRAITAEERNGRIAILSAGLLTLVAIGCGSLGLWRVGADLEWAGDFVIQDGLLSHWQVWVGAAIGMQYTSWWLVRYAGIRRVAAVELSPRSASADGSVRERAAAL